MEMSRARISSAVGVRPMPKVGPCADAVALASTTSDTNDNAGRSLLALLRGGASLRVVAIGDAPVAGDVPGHDGVVQAGDAERLVDRFVEVLGDLGNRRLH